MAMAHVMQLLLEGQSTGVLGVCAIDQIAERRHTALGIALEPDRSHAFAVDRSDLLARTQVSDRLGSRRRAHAVSDAAARSAAVEAEHQSRPFGRAAMDEGIDAKRPVRS